jgi:hypothetical protein
MVRGMCYSVGIELRLSMLACSGNFDYRAAREFRRNTRFYSYIVTQPQQKKDFRSCNMQQVDLFRQSQPLCPRACVVIAPRVVTARVVTAATGITSRVVAGSAVDSAVPVVISIVRRRR